LGLGCAKTSQSDADEVVELDGALPSPLRPEKGRGAVWAPSKKFRLPLGSRRIDRDAIRRTCSMSVPRLLSLSLKFTPIRRFFAQHTRLTQKEACRLIR
jgi:hypothetical protein